MTDYRVKVYNILKKQRLSSNTRLSSTIVVVLLPQPSYCCCLPDLRGNGIQTMAG